MPFILQFKYIFIIISGSELKFHMIYYNTFVHLVRPMLFFALLVLRMKRLALAFGVGAAADIFRRIIGGCVDSEKETLKIFLKIMKPAL